MGRPLVLIQDEKIWLIHQITYAINDIGVLMHGTEGLKRQSYKEHRAALRVLLTKVTDA